MQKRYLEYVGYIVAMNIGMYNKKTNYGHLYEKYNNLSIVRGHFNF